MNNSGKSLKNNEIFQLKEIDLHDSDIIKKFVNTNVNGEGSKPIIIAMEEGNFDIIFFLTSNGAKIRYKDLNVHGLNILQLAICTSKINIVLLILDYIDEQCEQIKSQPQNKKEVNEIAAEILNGFENNNYNNLLLAILLHAPIIVESLLDFYKKYKYRVHHKQMTVALVASIQFKYNQITFILLDRNVGNFLKYFIL